MYIKPVGYVPWSVVLVGVLARACTEWALLVGEGCPVLSHVICCLFTGIFLPGRASGVWRPSFVRDGVVACSAATRVSVSARPSASARNDDRRQQVLMIFFSVPVDLPGGGVGGTLPGAFPRFLCENGLWWIA